MLPNFLCVGAQKCGVTTIAYIYGAGQESPLFCEDFQFSAEVQKYEIQHFSGWKGQSAAGEECPDYLFVSGTAQRIYTMLGPRVKLIVALRSPAQRAFSHYRHTFTMLRESRTFEEVLAFDEEQWLKGNDVRSPFGYLARGFYARQLAEYVRLFPADQFFYVHFEKDIVLDQRALCAKINDFLEIETVYPQKLPFRAGHAMLENQFLRYTSSGSDLLHDTVDVGNRSYRVWRAAGLWRRIFRKSTRVTNSNELTRIDQPSEALMEFARCYQANTPKASTLTRERELAINRRYFQEDIRQLGEIAPFDLSRWLGD